MEKLTTALLAGAAISAIAAVPANAVMPVAKSFNDAMHFKTSAIHNPENTKTTTVVTYSGKVTGSKTALYKKTVFLGGVAWVTNNGKMGGKCHDAKGQVATYSKAKGLKAKVKGGKVKSPAGTVKTSGGKTYCKGGSIDYYGPNYKLLKKQTGKDTFTEKDTVPSGGNNYVLKVDWTVNVT